MSVAIQPQHKLHIMMRTTIEGELVKLMSIGTRGTTLHRFGRLQEGSAMTWPTIWPMEVSPKPTEARFFHRFRPIKVS
jgi:hypothetical protein